MPLQRFAIDDFGDHLHTRTDRKHVPYSRGLKKADFLIKDLQLQGVRDVIVDVTCRHEFRPAATSPVRRTPTPPPARQRTPTQRPTSPTVCSPVCRRRAKSQEMWYMRLQRLLFVSC